MIFLRFILLLIPLNAIIAQKNIIEDIFSKNIFQIEFKEDNTFFPIEQNGDKFSTILRQSGEYFIGTGQSNHIIMMAWENDLINFEFKTAFKLAPEEGINLFQTEPTQSFGLILKYNPDTQEGLIFETNSNKQYRFVHIINNKKKPLTYSKDNGWIKSENLRKNKKNEILIKTKNNNYEFYINGEFEFKTDLTKKRIQNISAGRFGLYLAPNTKSKIDYIYISTNQDYNGINKTLTLSQEEIKKIIKENDLLRENKNQIETSQTKELKNVIHILEEELKSINIINDSLESKNKEFDPFLNIIGENKDFLYTLSKDLREQIEKNQLLKLENKTLLDSISILIQQQELFKLEYLQTLDLLMKKETQDTIK